MRVSKEGILTDFNITPQQKKMIFSIIKNCHTSYRYNLNDKSASIYYLIAVGIWFQT